MPPSIDFKVVPANDRASVHHFLPSGHFQHPEHSTELDLHVQDPWEIIQTVVKLMHGRDIAHRIRLIQDNLVVRRSTTGEMLQKNLVSLQDRAKALENTEQEDDEALWNELRWDLISLRAELSKHEPAPRRRPLRKWLRETFIGR